MKAAFYRKYGPPEVLQIREISIPEPAPNEIRVKVHATTVNRTDCGIRSGSPFIIQFFSGLFRPKNPITGTDFAGVVDKIGKGVTKFKPGDRLFGFHDNGLGSHAEYITIRADRAISTIPEQISFQEAAASIEGAHYAFNFINKVPVRAGDRILVNGATGAIGSAMVQLLKHYGAYVVAVGDTGKLNMAEALGADEVIDYRKEDFTKIDQSFHYVFDAVGKSTFGKCNRLLKPGGVYISSELGPWGQNPIFAILTPLFGKKKVIFPVPTDIPRSLALVRELLETGAFRPVIDRTYTLDQIVDAFRYVETGQKTGNVVVEVG